MGYDASADFSQATKQLMARRAGFMCSLPWCRRPTSGPGSDSQSAISIGEACHIYSASERGPRGTGGLSPEERTATDNGIWLCGDHGHVIDTNEGRDFPASALHGYRQLHEAWVRGVVSGDAPPTGWIDSIEVGYSPLKLAATLKLGKATLVYGKNATGKTTLLRWISSLDSLRALRGWMYMTHGTPGGRFCIRFYSPAKHEFRAEMEGGRVRCELDDRPVPYNPVPHRVFFMDDVWTRSERRSPMNRLAAATGLDLVSLRNLIDAMGHKLASIDRVEYHGERDAKDRVLVRVDREAPLLPFSALSAGEQTRVAFDMLIAKASWATQYSPVLVVFDLGYCFDEAGLLYYLRYLQSEKVRFQSVIVLPRVTPALLQGPWSCAEVGTTE